MAGFAVTTEGREASDFRDRGENLSYASDHNNGGFHNINFRL
jgi:hypothetical protein